MKRLRITICLISALFTCSAWAMTPPEYLSVPNWQSCSESVKKGTAEYVCLPKYKPRECPAPSWRKLTHKHLLDRCQK